MVSGKPSNQSARGVDIPPTTRILVLPVTRFDVWEYVLLGNQEYGPAVAYGGSDPRVGMKGKWLLWNNRWMFQACELGLSCKAEIRFRNRPFLAEIETA
jgi:hypothetical protein